MPATFDINQDEVIKLTKKLSKLHKSALPVAIRQTLNDAAFIGRRKSIAKFRRNFDVKTHAKRFPTAHIQVQKSPNTFNVNRMISQVGVIKGKSRSGDQLDKQELGGQVKDRDVPTKDARVSGNAHAPINRALYKKLWKNRKKGLVYKSGESRIIKTQDRLLRVKRGSIWKTLFIFNRSFRLEKQPFIAFGARQASAQITKIYHKRATKRIARELK
jgi:hypothetical protein